MLIKRGLTKSTCCVLWSYDVNVDSGNVQIYTCIHLT